MRIFPLAFRRVLLDVAAENRVCRFDIIQRLALYSTFAESIW
jgi:hypothetical protein